MGMKTFIVSVREVHVSHRQVEADSPEDAIQRVQDGEDEEISMEYSHSLETDTWTVVEEKDFTG